MIKYFNSHPTSLLENTLCSYISHSTDKLEKYSRQITSMELYDSFAEMEEDNKLESVLNLKKSLSETEDFYRGNNIAKSRIEAQDHEMTNIIEVMRNLKTNMISAQSAAFSNVPLDIISDYSLTQIAQSLNSEYSGFYLFSGSKTSTRPLGDVTQSDQINNYYGDNESLCLQVTEMLEIQYSKINAGTNEFNQLLNLMPQIKKAHENEDRNQLFLLEKQLDDIMSWVIDTRANLESNIKIIEDSMNFQERDMNFLKENLSEEIAVTEKNYGEIVIKFLESKRILESGYKVLIQVLNLDLVDFI